MSDSISPEIAAFIAFSLPGTRRVTEERPGPFMPRRLTALEPCQKGSYYTLKH
jgi:hypothetical protein